MTTTETAVRQRLEAQGYVGVGSHALAQIQFGLRFSPALCALGTAIGTALGSAPVLLFMMATAVAGAAAPRHPFDLLYNGAVRHALGKPPIPRNGLPGASRVPWARSGSLPRRESSWRAGRSWATSSAPR